LSRISSAVATNSFINSAGSPPVNCSTTDWTSSIFAEFCMYA
jgi:hypothetical protein